MTTAELLEREWTEEDLQRLPDDGRGFEILDGRLLRKPVPTIDHQDIRDALFLALHLLLPPGLAVRRELTINFGPSSRVPDLVVVHRSALPRRTERTLSLQPAAVVLALEVASDSTEADDRLRKHAEYAAAGIPFYWRVLVDDPPQAWVARLASTGDTAYTTEGPTSHPSVPYVVDLTDLPT